jgi:hypothetical protein
MSGRSAQNEMQEDSHFDLTSLPVHSPQGKPAINRGETRHLRRFPAAATGVADQKVLGETPEAVKPCLEEYEQEQQRML